jgi:hypothetical protein
VRKSFEALSAVLEDQPKTTESHRVPIGLAGAKRWWPGWACHGNALACRNPVIDAKTRVPIMDAWRIRCSQMAVFVLESFVQQTRRYAGLLSCSGTCADDGASEQSSNADVCWYD